MIKNKIVMAHIVTQIRAFPIHKFMKFILVFDGGFNFLHT